ncbi:D-tagatose-bisphosphate aldolase, class II, non-catalytic subunit [Burkholderia vietnamiensis]|uniref:D-tagatose-bisphosphate aldolase, class II, non-catalytic subunit n=1 Tax=Burkholderia vietnamiensis TaxID=60552 RepID=UPI001B8F8AD8|nr:D-tagatose-bisphosphate aldolase, class II, non-catalytic subunit [Burkholderia vietnamiensis]MBR8215524.1 D-tagatose-bisphosphate aldolase, class II, non-catalytic subunit [Burkholderia vietnamiensis]HDV8352405.1 D-tagatose-bisphosphate aldolase, class II, non-catalytic subunit [Burkholderia vietnamiensis]
MNSLLDLVRRHKQSSRHASPGAPAIGIPSVCSAHPVAIAAALRECAARERPALVEATCNQVNQDGGYTGMTPHDFRRYVFDIAARERVSPDAILLGGDHLGPNAWRRLPAAHAMDKAETMVAQYVAAGFRKLHLDCSMSCADDPQPLPEAEIAARAVRLCRAAEAAWAAASPRGDAAVYVIGTEVPVPGGAHETLDALAVTSPDAAGSTLALHRDAFARAGLDDAWSRVIAMVVQPGVEFDHHKVIDYDAGKARELSAFIEREPALVFEAHSTDYQTPGNLAQLVRDHFAILKVGPGVTFAMRETLWSLAAIEREWLGGDDGFIATVLGVMRSEPAHWRDYYAAGAQLELDLAYSLSDRIRYYWAHPAVQRACAGLLARLDASPPPLTLVSQHLPRQYEAVREGRLALRAGALLQDGTAAAVRPYLHACAA